MSIFPVEQCQLPHTRPGPWKLCSYWIYAISAKGKVSLSPLAEIYIWYNVWASRVELQVSMRTNHRVKKLALIFLFWKLVDVFRFCQSPGTVTEVLYASLLQGSTTYDSLKCRILKQKSVAIIRSNYHARRNSQPPQFVASQYALISPSQQA